MNDFQKFIIWHRRSKKMKHIYENIGANDKRKHKAFILWCRIQERLEKIKNISKNYKL